MKRLISLTTGLAICGMLAAACASGGAGSLGAGPTSASTSPSTPTGGPTVSPTATPTQARLFNFQLWLAKGGKLFETKRTAPFRPTVAQLALDTLVQGANAAESSAGVGTAIPSGTSFAMTGVPSGGMAAVQASPSAGSLLARAQVVYTLTQYANIRKVRFAGDNSTYTRASLESSLPAITVESPVIGQQVSSPVRVAGTANVFEGTVNVRILDSQGHELARTFTTATCGSGCRGDYSVALKYRLDHQQSGTVEVLDYSPRDGSPENVVDIPVILNASTDPAPAAIVINNPNPGAVVSSPVTVSGTADVFEAQFRIRILDENGHILADVPAHATCGTGCRGTYSVVVRYHVSHRQGGTIEAFDYSPRDGSIIDLVKVRVTLTP